MPAHRERLRAKALESRVASFVLDLEDAVPPAEKDAARLGAVAFARARPDVAFVRVNPIRPSTGFSLAVGAEDIGRVAGAPLLGIVVPKVEVAADVAEASDLTAAAERKAGRPAGATHLVALIETARGIANLAEICQARPARTWCLAFGAGDFTADIGISWSAEEGECATARALVVIASRAAGLPPPIDSAHPEIQDEGQMAASARRARATGFGSKFAIHPRQVPVFESVLRPGPDEIDWARRVLDGLAVAEAAGNGAFSVDGCMVDYPIVERSRQILARAADPSPGASVGAHAGVSA